MKKLSQRHLVLRKISKRDKPDIESIILDMRDRAKNDEELQKKFKEYGVSVDDIDEIPISFCDLDVSAKTKDKKIYLNEAMLADDSPVDDPTHYLIHELIHYLQQKTGKNMDKHRAEDDYLDKETEEEAFKTQIDFKKREESEEDAEEYVEQLLTHHDLKGKKRQEKKKELLDE